MFMGENMHTHTHTTYTLDLFYFRCGNCTTSIFPRLSHTQHLLAVADCNLRFQIPKTVCPCDLIIPAVWGGCGRALGAGKDQPSKAQTDGRTRESSTWRKQAE